MSPCQRRASRGVLASFTGGFGADAVIVTASSKSSEPFNHGRRDQPHQGPHRRRWPRRHDHRSRRLLQARARAEAVDVLRARPRTIPAYELAGHDYPLPYVRWTEQRNMAAFLDLIAEGKVTPKALVTHRFAIAEAEKAYELMESRRSRIWRCCSPIRRSGTTRRAAIATSAGRRASRKREPASRSSASGNYARGVLLPAFARRVEFGLTTRRHLDRHQRRPCERQVRLRRQSPPILPRRSTTRQPTPSSSPPATTRMPRLRRGFAAPASMCSARSRWRSTRPGSSRDRGCARARPGVLTVGFNRRFAPLLVKAKAALEPRSGPLVMLYRQRGRIPAESWIQREEGGGRISARSATSSTR